MINREQTVKHSGMGYSDEKCSSYCFSWSAIIAGTLVAVGLAFILNLFGLAINLSAYSMTTEGTLTFIAAGFFSTLVATMIVLFFAGWVSGYLARPYGLNPNLGFLYGLITWCLSLVVTIILAAQIGQFVNEQYLTLTLSNDRSSSNATQAMAPLLTTQSRVIKTLEGSSSNQKATQGGKMSASEAKDVKAVSKGLFLLFILFFVGALSACYGGHVGMQRRNS